MTPYVFIVGSSRSGTTILNDVLGRHPHIASWHEPYFIWDYCLGTSDDDVRTAQEANHRVKKFVRHEFATYLRKSGTRLLVEKVPEHCYHIPFVHTVFPEAKWIHIIRDGRDSILSIHREWVKRSNIVEQKNYRSLWQTFQAMISKQPFWRNRLQAIWFEVKNTQWSSGSFLNKAKWGGRVGYGQRFPGWKQALRQHSVLEFNALQWTTTVKWVRKNLATLPADLVIELRYEEFLKEPEATLKGILDFLGENGPLASGMTNGIYASNSRKWANAFTSEQIKTIGPLINDLLIELGYERDNSWYTSDQAKIQAD